MNIDILSVFPEMFVGPFDHSIVRRAQENALVSVSVYNLRTFSSDQKGVVDDYQFGGGPGMVMKPDPIFEGVETILKDLSQSEMAKTRVILTSPQGKMLTQGLVSELALQSHLIIICGHYEGVDERIRENLITDDISIGDYVLTGGEIAAMVITDSVVRLLPGAIGSQENLLGDSISSGLLQHPIYTRPAQFRNMKIPSVLTSGHHQNIKVWRRRKALERTLARRRDLLDIQNLSAEDRDYLESLGYNPNHRLS
jgi:tRNA (guanine37-N1)-methyltransferase